MPPPRIIEHPKNITVPLEQTAVFVCVGQGYGFVEVNWNRARNNKVRPLPGKSAVVTKVTSDDITTITSTLTLPDLASGHRGNYWCEYSNNVSETLSYIGQLTIGSKCF